MTIIRIHKNFIMSKLADQISRFSFSLSDGLVILFGLVVVCRVRVVISPAHRGYGLASAMPGLPYLLWVVELSTICFSTVFLFFCDLFVNNTTWWQL